MATDAKRQPQIRVQLGTLRDHARATGIDGLIMARGYTSEGEEVEVDITGACRGFGLEAKAGELDVLSLRVINFTVEDPDGQLK